MRDKPKTAFATAATLIWRESDLFIRVRMGLALACALASAALLGLSPLLLKLLVDRFATDPAQAAAASTLWLLAAYVLSQALSRSLGELRWFSHGAAEQRLVRHISTHLFEHLLALPLRIQRQRQSGSMVQILANGVMGLRTLLSHLSLTLVPVVIEFTTIAVVLIQFGRADFLPIFAVSMVLYVLAFRVSVRGITGPSRAVSSAQVESSAVLQDLLSNGETLKSFNAEPYAQARFGSRLQKTENDWRMFYRNRARGGLLVASVFILSLATTVLFAARLVANGGMSVGDFVLVSAYMLQVVRPLEMIGFAMRDIGQALANLELMAGLLNLPREVDHAEDKEEGGHYAHAMPFVRSIERKAGELVFDDVTFRYEAEREPALRNLSFTVRAGGTVGIVGTTGSGKSSITRLLLRLYDPDQGRILLDDVDLRALPLKRLRDRIAIVPQDAGLFNETIGKNILLRQGNSDFGALEHAAKLARIHDLIGTLPEGFDTVIGERGVKLSGGERQRVAIARAALKHPSLFVFDEATSALDATTEREVLNQLRTVAMGTTSLIIAHRLSAVTEADQILVLENGSVVERGTHTSLLRDNGRYAELWEAQQKSPRGSGGPVAA
ncbi:ATP-binding cassette domain-containing protein [Roseiterribacter gracilis]|uniref:ABC transporter n=1 Tax=Roseiterribacter gracilis TaxID=2812848 RepID=A0A8S8XDN7_9PROT|nr:ABC transporter [Rhodospirillales bacterium TMPK1]